MGLDEDIEDAVFEGGGQGEETFRVDQEAAALEQEAIMELQVFEGMACGAAWCASGKGLFETVSYTHLTLPTIYSV